MDLVYLRKVISIPAIAILLLSPPILNFSTAVNAQELDSTAEATNHCQQVKKLNKQVKAARAGVKQCQASSTSNDECRKLKKKLKRLKKKRKEAKSLCNIEKRDVNGDGCVSEKDFHLAVHAVENPDWIYAYSADVDLNGLLTPFDSLLIANYLNDPESPGICPSWYLYDLDMDYCIGRNDFDLFINAIDDPESPTAIYADLNFDKMITPIDGLQIVNYINDPNTDPSTLCRTEAASAITLDRDGNGCIDTQDAQIVRFALNHTEWSHREIADTDGDGSVTPTDLSLIINYINESSSPNICPDWYRFDTNDSGCIDDSDYRAINDLRNSPDAKEYPFVDVDMNGTVDNRDSAWIIGYLNNPTVDTATLCNPDIVLDHDSRDVDGNGCISSRDANIVVFAIDHPNWTSPLKHIADVNGDGMITSGDSMEVINALNAAGPEVCESWRDFDTDYNGCIDIHDAETSLEILEAGDWVYDSNTVLTIDNIEQSYYPFAFVDAKDSILAPFDILEISNYVNGNPDPRTLCGHTAQLPNPDPEPEPQPNPEPEDTKVRITQAEVIIAEHTGNYFANVSVRGRIEGFNHEIHAVTIGFWNNPYGGGALLNSNYIETNPDSPAYGQFEFEQSLSGSDIRDIVITVKKAYDNHDLIPLYLDRSIVPHVWPRAAVGTVYIEDPEIPEDNLPYIFEPHFGFAEARVTADTSTRWGNYFNVHFRVKLHDFLATQHFVKISFPGIGYIVESNVIHSYPGDPETYGTFTYNVSRPPGTYNVTLQLMKGSARSPGLVIDEVTIPYIELSADSVSAERVYSSPDLVSHPLHVRPSERMETFKGPYIPFKSSNMGEGERWDGGTSMLQVCSGSSGMIGPMTNSPNTKLLVATGYGFQIPEDAVITGIEATVAKKAAHSDSEKTIRDEQVRLVRAGQPGSENKAETETSWPFRTFGHSTYGGANDLWGESWTPEDINHEDFGIAVSATSFEGEPGGARTGHIDCMLLKVFYTIGGQ
ncbi:MAG: hypothetical protein KDD60_03005 [Bdellovibrionales bacterium]|nr:hypothetical protein [Bdellovibrionales bacterium]